MTEHISTRPYGATLELHLPASHHSDVTARHGDYDLVFYPATNTAIAFLGWHPVAVYDVERNVVHASTDIEQRLRVWAMAQAAQLDDVAVSLTPAGDRYAAQVAARRAARGAHDRV